MAPMFICPFREGNDKFYKSFFLFKTKNKIFAKRNSIGVVQFFRLTMSIKIYISSKIARNLTRW